MSFISDHIVHNQSVWTFRPLWDKGLYHLHGVRVYESLNSSLVSSSVFMAIRNGLIMVASYSAPPTDPLFNRVVATFNGPVSHVELAFPTVVDTSTGFETGKMQAVCVYFDDNVEIKFKSYSRDNWAFTYFDITLDQLAKCKKLAADMQAKKISFSRYSMFATYIPVLPLLYNPRSPEWTCCSIITAQLLQIAGVLSPTVNPRRTTPMGLHRLLAGEHACKFKKFSAPSTRLKQMQATGDSTLFVRPVVV